MSASMFCVHQLKLGRLRRWDVQRGEQWVVFGPNGSGKSLLATILTGTTRTGNWRVEFADDLDDRVAGTGFGEQQSCSSGSWLQARWHGGFDEDQLSVEAFLSYDSVMEINPFAVETVDPEARRKFEICFRETSRRLELRSLLGRTVIQLSNGEMRRVLLARAVLKNPDILVLDDPFAGLDVRRRSYLKTILECWAKESKTLILMLRHADEIPSCATHRLILSDCRFISYGAVATLKPKHAEAVSKKTAPLTLVKTTATDPVIEMKDVEIRYGRRRILDRFSWVVRQGERWAITGPNGCGKTTLLSLITGDNPVAYANDIRIFGHSRTGGESLWRIRSRIGSVSPETQVYAAQELTCLETVLTGLSTEDGERAVIGPVHRQQARRLLADFEVLPQAGRTFGEVSSGLQRLVLLARALISNPELLILDEPCLNLDEKTRRHVLRTLDKVMRKRPEMTVLCVAHRPEDLPRQITDHLTLLARS